MTRFEPGRNAVERWNRTTPPWWSRQWPDAATRAALAATVDTRTPAEREYDEARERWKSVCNEPLIRAADKLRAERRPA